jgi:hypothetical protein
MWKTVSPLKVEYEDQKTGEALVELELVYTFTLLWPVLHVIAHTVFLCSIYWYIFVVVLVFVSTFEQNQILFQVSVL